MIVLLIGLVCFLGALRVASGVARDDDAPASPDVRGTAAAAWVGLLAALTLGQLWIGRADLDRYRFSLLGFRYRVADGVGAAPSDRSILLGGDPRGADVYVPGAGEGAVVELRTGGSGPGATGPVVAEVVATPVEDAGAVALVEESGLLGSSWRLLGSVPVAPGAAVEVRAQGGVWRVEFDSASARLPFVDAEVPIPWVTQPVAVVRRPGSADARRVVLPPVEGALLQQLRGARPSVFQRTYPLADVLQEVGGPGAAPPLGSFFYWQDDALFLADLDSEVALVPAASPAVGDVADGPSPGGEVVWSADGGGRRLLVAGLPHRDYPEPRLTLPERYGVRPLRSFRLDVHGDWLDMALGSPEVHALDRTALEELRLPGERDEEGRAVYRIRVAPGRDALARRAVVFDAAPAAFGAASQAVFRLPEDPRTGSMQVLTPSGLAAWETGRPLALGTGNRALLVRVDGLGTSASFWLVHLALFVMVGTLFSIRPMSGPVFALALAATGLASLRLLLGVGALASFPHVQEGQQIALWLLPLLPWSLVTMAEATRPRASDELLSFRAWREWIFHVLYVVALVALSTALFPRSPAKRVVLAAVPTGVLALWFAARGGWRPWVGAPERLRRLAVAHPRLLHGWSLGLGLLLLRVVLESAGWREQLTVGGTRIGVSVFYTPLLVVALAGLLWLQDRRIRDASGGPALPSAVASALFEVGGFLLFAYVAVSGWVSDFGIALVLLPGPLVLLARIGAERASGGRPGRLALLALGLPLLVFLLVQTAPPLLRFAWADDLRQADVRMGEWNRNELLLLERGDPSALRMIGQRRSEALAVMRETMRSYTRGNLLGKGFLKGRVSGEISETATREHAPSALLASQWGLPGTFGLALLLLGLLPPVTALLGRGGGGTGEDWRPAVWTLGLPLLVLLVVAFALPSPFNAVAAGALILAAVVALAGPAFGVAEPFWWGSEGAPRGATTEASAPAPEAPLRRLARLTATLALFTVAFAGLYMVLANYGMTFFTGRNVYLLGLDSVGDVLEGLALLGVAALALGVESEPGEGRAPAGGWTSAGPKTAVAVRSDDSEEWWREGGDR